MIIPYPEPDDLPEETVAALGRLPSLNIIRAFGAAPTYTPGLIDMAIAGLGKLSLTERQRELLIVETASHIKARLVFEDHQPICKAVGVTTDEMETLWRRDPFPASLDAAEGALLDVARELLTTGTCGRVLVETLQAMCGARATAECLIIVGFYRMIGGFANALAIEPDAHTRVEQEILPYFCGRDDV